MLTRILTIIATLFLSACVPITPNISQSEEIGPNESILIAKFNSVQASGRLQIHQGVISFPYAAISVQPDERQLKVIKIRGAKDLHFATYTVGNKSAYFEKNTLNFDIAPRTIAYIGDIIVIEKPQSVAIRFVDNESETLEEARQMYPELFAKYRYMKSLPGKKRGE